jgi:hypothetical protein
MVLAANGDSGFFGRLHDFFGSGSWPVIQNLLIFFVVVFWLAVGYWVYKDARRRIEDLPRGHRRELPRLPGLHDASAPGLRHVQATARAPVAGLSVL